MSCRLNDADLLKYDASFCFVYDTVHRIRTKMLGLDVKNSKDDIFFVVVVNLLS